MSDAPSTATSGPPASAPLEGEVIARESLPSGENTQQLHARFAYIGAGTSRSLSLVEEDLGISASVLGKWRKAFNWDAEAREYDLRLLEEEQERKKGAQLAHWATIEETHLAIARLLRRKVLTYFKDREIEGVPNPGGKGWLIRGMDPAKLALCLKMLEQAERTERNVFAPLTKAGGDEDQSGALQPEQIAREVALADAAITAFHQQQQLPPPSDTNPLGDFAL